MNTKKPAILKHTDLTLVSEEDKFEADNDLSDPEQYSHQKSGRIVVYDDDLEEIQVGEWGTYFVDVRRAFASRYSIRDAMDIDGTLYDYYYTLIDPRTYGFKATVYQALPGLPRAVGNLFILDQISFCSDRVYKSKKAEVAAAILNRYAAGAAVIALNVADIPADVADALNFQLVADSSYMVRAL